MRFTTSVDGKPEPEIEWYKNDVLVKPSKNVEIKSTSSLCNMVIKSATPEDAGLYKVIAKNDAGQAEVEAELKVGASDKSKPKPSNKPSFVTKLLNSYPVEEGDETTLQVEFTGTPKPKVLWEKNGTEIISIKRVKVTDQDGSSKLTIKSFRESDVGVYTVTISNSQELQNMHFQF